MTYLDRVEELKEEIRDNIHHSDNISLDTFNEYNRIIDHVMYGSKTWDDEYKQAN